jgi:hypothetical protein
VTRLGAAYPTNLVPISGRSKRVLSSLKRYERLWDSFGLINNDYQEFYLRVKRPGREADRLSLYNDEANNKWFCNFTLTQAVMLGPKI